MRNSIFKKDFIYLFLERGRQREREGEKHQHVVASYTPPYWGPGLPPRHVPQLGIKLVIPQFAGWHPIH